MGTNTFKPPNAACKLYMATQEHITHRKSAVQLWPYFDLVKIDRVWQVLEPFLLLVWESKLRMTRRWALLGFVGVCLLDLLVYTRNGVLISS